MVYYKVDLKKSPTNHVIKNFSHLLVQVGEIDFICKTSILEKKKKIVTFYLMLNIMSCDFNVSLLNCKTINGNSASQ